MKILVSRGYGAGWSTWADDQYMRDMVTWQPIIDFIESGKEWPPEGSLNDPDPVKAMPEVASLIKRLADRHHNGDIDKVYLYTGGLRQCSVEEIPDGSSFRITEYDGAEDYELRSDDSGWMS